MTTDVALQGGYSRNWTENVGDLVDKRFHECISACTDCHDVCLATVQYCLSKGGPHADPQHIRTLQDCAEICQASANFMVRQSPAHEAICGACSDICYACAAECDSMGDDQQMRKCAEACRKCGDSCKSMMRM